MKPRRIVGLIVVIGLVLIGRLFLARPVAVDLELTLGPSAPSLKRASLVFTDQSERVARSIDLSWPDGAQPIDHRRVSLSPGDYTVGARLESADGARTLSRPLHVERAGTYPIDLSN
jgi:hypothetical protein